MKIYIFNVGHGFCAYLHLPNGQNMMIDCGTSKSFSPCAWLHKNGETKLDRLVISNYDEDHIGGLIDIDNEIRPKCLVANKTVTPEDLEAMKKPHPLSNAMECLINMMRIYTAPAPAFPRVDFSVVNPTFQYFCNDNDRSSDCYRDSNNLSFVTFLKYEDHGILFPGDLEKKGWLKLLDNDDFKEMLREVTVFVASHHGRENGYCEEVFHCCKPHVVIISDEEKKYDTQETTDRYAQHATGIRINGKGWRKVLTTRKDGSISLDLTNSDLGVTFFNEKI